MTNSKHSKAAHCPQSRRAFLATAAVAAALPLSAGAAAPAGADPIFAAIEAHRSANLEFYAALKLAPGTLSPDVALETKFGDAEGEARWALATTAPASLPGLTALLQYLSDVQDGTATGSPDEAFGERELSEIVLNAHLCLSGRATA